MSAADPPRFHLSTPPDHFGLPSANSASGTATKVSGIDEFHVTLNTTVVPEPASLSAIAAMAILGRRRRAR